jgi:hypothetical protein
VAASGSTHDWLPAAVALAGLIVMGAIFGSSARGRRHEGDDDMGELIEGPDFRQIDLARAPGPEEPEPGNDGAPRDLDGVGEHITSVLAAAEAAAAKLRSEAEGESQAMLRDAEREAREIRERAEAKAAAIMLEAERSAGSMADTSRERHRVVLSNIATSEARLRDLAKSLRGVATALDTVVGDDSSVEPTANGHGLEGRAYR